MYQVGTKVVHPIHGLGEVESLEVKEVLGTTISMAGISFQEGRLQVSVNISSPSAMIRPVMSPEEVEEVMDFIRNGVTEVPSRANERHTYHLNAMKTGGPMALAHVVKNTIFYTGKKRISAREVSLMKQARRILACEIAAVTGCNEDEMEQIIDRSSRRKQAELVPA